MLSTAVLAAAGLRQAGYQLTPKRLTPGFEHRLSTAAMVAVYGALAAGFALGAVLLQDRGKPMPAKSFLPLR